MAGKLQKEIHKTRPFDTLQQEAHLNLVRTCDFVMRSFDDLLKPYNLSAAQYNVLRILRGHGEASGPEGPGIPCKVIGEEMLTRDPDITRLLDRLEARNLIARQRDTRDRRVVSTRILVEGLRVLKELDKPVIEFHREQFSHMSEAKLAQLIDLLELARSPE